MRTLKLTLAYDGTRFVGWQRQTSGESIQALLEAALGTLEGGHVSVHGAGRTDAGVHALGQVASANLASSHDAATILRACNAQLPADVRVTAVEDVVPEFHARFSATSKTYRYLMANEAVSSPFLGRFCWHITDPLDRHAMAAAAAALVGTHDFAAFQSTGTDVATTVRTLTQSQVRDETLTSPQSSEHRLLVYEVTGDGFLRHMVRAIVGTLVEVGRGQRNRDSMPALLDGRDRSAAGATAPAHGLFLVRVEY